MEALSVLENVHITSFGHGLLGHGVLVIVSVSALQGYELIAYYEGSVRWLVA